MAAAAAAELLLEEIIMNILVRCPVKSLVRFRCVCKTWRTLIDDPYFIRKHVNHVTSINKNMENEYQSQIFTVDNTFKEVTTTFYHMDIYNKYEEAGLDLQDHTNGTTPIAISVKELNFPGKFRRRLYDSAVMIKGCCDGMLCLADSDGLLIWNPSIKQCRRLPLTYKGDVYGIGYDPSVDDYKILKASSMYNSNKNDYLSHSVEVLALKSNSWKMIQDNFPYYIYFGELATFTNGGLHWLARRDVYGEISVMVYFDVVGEKLGEVSLPHSRGEEKGWFDDLQLLGEKLCLVWFGRGGDDKLDLWVMKEYKVRESWTKLLTVPLSEGLYNLPSYPFCFMGTGIVLCNKRTGEFLMYNARDLTSRRFFINGGFHDYSMKIPYTESLVSPISGYGFENLT